MSSLPPPTGRPVAFALHPDPWVEQARRHEEHRRAMRRRRRRLVVRGALTLVAVALIGGIAYAVRQTVAETADDTPATTVVTDSAATNPIATNPATSPAATNPAAAVSIEEVWLLDRGDGRFDWGAIVSGRELGDGFDTPPEIDVTVDLLGTDGSVVATRTGSIGRLGPGERAVEIGVERLGSRDDVPVRVDVRLSLTNSAVDATGAADGAEPGDEPGGVTPVVRSFERIGSGQLDVDDRLDAIVESDVAVPGASQVVAVWRDGDGAVVAAVAAPLVDLGAGATDVTMTLERGVVPTGAPDDVFWSR